MQATATWKLPAGWVRISSQTWGPFVIRELGAPSRRRGCRIHRPARILREGHGPRRAPRPTGSPIGPNWATPCRPVVLREIGWWVGVLFMIGSACFAFGSVPSLSEVLSAKVISSIYFVGSLFFTSAGYLQYVQASSAPVPVSTSPTSGSGSSHAAWVGGQPRYSCSARLFFNVTTFEALEHGIHRQPAEPAGVVAGLLWLDLLLGRELVRGERGGCAWPAPVALE